MKGTQGSLAGRLFVATAVALIATGCNNPLLVDIEETVSEVVKPPQVSAIYPAADAVDVPVNTDLISVTFSKVVNGNTVTTSTFYVAPVISDGSLGAPIAGTRVVQNNQNETISFDPNDELAHDTTYRVVITTGVLDVDGNSMGEEYSWEFTTGLSPDTAGPTEPSVIINDGDAWSTSATVTLTLAAIDNRGIAQMNISNGTSFSDSNWTTFQSTYEWTVPGDGSRTVRVKFKDAAGNQSDVAQDTISVDTTNPFVTVFLVDGGRSATKNSSVSLGVTAEDTESSSGVANYRARLIGDDWPAAWSSLDSNGSALVADVALPSGLSSDDTVTFEVQVRDVAGNVSTVDSATIAYDLTSPSVQSDLTSPAVNQINVPYDTSVIHIYFNEEINLATITPESFYVENSGGSGVPGDFEFSDYDEITFGHVSLTGLDLEPNTTYFVTVTTAIQDVAGNDLVQTEPWFFETGNATDTTPPSGTVSILALAGSPDPNVYTFVELPDGTYATNYLDLVLKIDAVDDYNLVYGMNFWGEGLLDAIAVPFEDPTNGWEAYNPADPTKSWVLANEERTHNLWYRFQDSRGNKTPDPPGYFSVVLDTSAPDITSVQITNATEDGAGRLYINDPDGQLNLVISANDIGGSGIKGSGLHQMRFSNDGNFDTAAEDWIAWSPLYSDWTTDIASNGAKILYVDVADYLGNNYAYVDPDPDAAPLAIPLYYDTQAPVITFSTGDPADPFDTGDILVIHEAATQTVTVTDNVIGAVVGNVDDDLTYQWEQVSGPAGGTITFTTTDIRQPSVEATDNGTYLLKLTATDPAGNSSFATVSLLWDQDPPAAIGPVTAANGAYSTDGYPDFSWDPVAGADFYLVEVRDSSNNLVIDPPSQIQETSYSPFEIVAGEQVPVQMPEGEDVTITVTPFDFAGNFTPPTGGNGTATVFTDTIAPDISGDGQLFLRNTGFDIDYGTLASPSGVDGGITETDGLASALWEQTSGPAGGTITFGDSGALKTSVLPTTHGYYGIRLTVTDNAGNSGMANFTANWDITGPNAPNVGGIDHTPAVLPTWSWSSGGGGGYGYYRWELWSPGDVSPTEQGEGSVTSFVPASPLDPDTDTDIPADGMGNDPDGHTYILRVWERDEVGNWSATYGTHPIWVDGGYTAPPEVTVDGPLVRNTNSMTWNWSSGADQSGATYRWQIFRDDPNTAGDDHAFVTQNSGYPGGVVAASTTYNATLVDGDDFTYTIEVEEYYTAETRWIGKLGTATVRVDRLGPDGPDVVSLSGDRTRDTTPSWRWSTNPASDGVGTYRYHLDNTDLSAQPSTTATVFTAGALGDGNHTLYVQEQDSLGNWGESGQYNIEVDTTPPAVPTIVINSGDYSTNSTTLSVTITPVSESDPAAEMSILDYYPESAWEAWEPVGNKTTQVPDGEGTKRVYVRVRDVLGNTSGYVYDTIILDQTAPSNGSITLNGGDFYTPSLDVYMDLAATDNYSTQENLEVQYYHYNSGYNGTYPSTWEPFAAHKLANTDFAPSQAYKYVYVRFRDEAGNVSGWSNDSIYLQIPEPIYAWKGYYTGGASRVYYNPVTEPTGSYNTSYYTYYAPYYSDPDTRTINNVDPNQDPGGVTMAGSTPTTSTSYDYINSVPEGELLNFWIRPYNSDAGGWGAFSTTSALGFSSEVTVIYDDDETADIDRAAKIREILTDETGSVASAKSGGWVVGTVPDLTVTLLPEDLIENTYAEANKIFGDPIILSSGVTYSTSSTYDPRVQNIASTMRPVMGMGAPGLVWLGRIATNFATWGLSGTSPTALGYGHVGHQYYTAERDANTRPYSSSQSIWYSPLYHNNLIGSWASVYTTTITTVDANRYSVYNSTGLNPTDGAIYAGDPNTTLYYPVVRQGRYLLYGYTEPADTLSRRQLIGKLWIGTNSTGRLFFLNLAEQMRANW